MKDEPATVESSERLRLELLGFAGSVLGVYVHEANNRLATLKESVGLLGDLLQAARSGRAEGVKESLRLAADLEKQISSFAALNRHLEGFAEGLQSPSEGIELPRSLDGLLSLTARLARQKRIRIQTAAARSIPPLPLEPAAFLLLVHHLVTRGCELLAPQGTLRLRSLRERGMTTIEIGLEGYAGPEPLADDRGRALARSLGAQLEEVPGSPEVKIRFRDSV